MELIIFSLLLIIHSTVTYSKDCYRISACPNFQSTVINKDTSEDFSFKPPVPSYEHQVAQEGNILGIKPLKYEINLNFQDRTHYNGSVKINVQLVKPTDEILINLHPKNPKVDYNQIYIETQCEGGQSPAESNKAPSDAPCIEKAIFDELNQTVTLQLNNKLQQDGNGPTQYAVVFASFSGIPRTSDSKGSFGLFPQSSGQRSRGSKTLPGYYSFTTIFQMRYARTVFPSFDQPALKATFSLCIEHPNDLEFASNTLPIPEKSKMVNANRKLTCFEQTPIMPTYTFTFALMQNYSLETYPLPDGRSIEVYSPKGMEDKFRWIFNATEPVLNYLDKVLDFKYPLKRLAYLIQYPTPFWGVENWGLVSLDGSFIEMKKALAYSIVHHEILHQWLGDLVTVSDWREVCLQEGIVSYMEYVISARRINGSVDETVDKLRPGIDHHYTSNYYDADTAVDYYITKDIEDKCFRRSPFFFHTIAAALGYEVIEQFAAKLVKKHPYASASLADYDDALSEVTNGQLKGFIKGWFGQPGILHLYASKVPNKDCILIHQQLVKAKNYTPVATVVRPVPLKIQLIGSTTENKTAVITSQDQEICELGKLDNVGFVLDPNFDTLTRKAYHAGNYRLVLENLKTNPTFMSRKQQEQFAHSFCRVLMTSVLPLQDDPAAEKASEWQKVYELFLKSGVTPEACACCLDPKMEGKGGNQCVDMGCGKLRLTKVVGYTFKEARHADRGDKD